MLLGDFFYLTKLQIEDNFVSAVLNLNIQHPIFAGHFPGHPVVPGVCMMQMVKETAEKALEKELKLTKASQLKFLKVINPLDEKEVQINMKINFIENHVINIDAQVINSAHIFFKMKGVFSS